jgi:F-type H+-transporting ATPase subunit b
MYTVWPGGRYAAVAGVVFLLLVGDPRARAADNEKTHHKPVYNTTIIDDDGKEIERKYDATNPKDVKELADLLKAGHVQQVELEKEVNILALKWDLGLWTLVVFLLLLWLLNKLAWKPMLEGLQKREFRIRNALDEAEKTRKEAEKLRGEFQAQMDQANEKARALIEEARKAGEKLEEEMKTIARAEIQADKERKEREIEREHEQAIRDVYVYTTQLATALASKAIRRQVTIDDQRHLVDEAIAELKTAAGERKRFVRGDQA